MTAAQGGSGFNLGSALGFIDLDSSPLEGSVNRATSALDRLRGAGSSLQSIGSNISGFGAQLTAFTAPFAAGIGVGVKVAADFDASLTQIQARAGLTDEALNLVREQALQLGADTIFSTQDASDAFLQLLTAGLDAEEAMTALPAILDGAAAAGADLGTTADLVTNVLTSFNLEADQAGRVVDLMARGAGASPASMEEMGRALQMAGGLASEFGLELEDTTSMMAIFAQNGIRGENAATQLRSIMTNMTSPTENTTRAWELLGTSLFDAEGNMRDFDTVLGDIESGMAGLTDEQKAFVTQNLAGSYGRVGFNALLASDGIEAMNDTLDEQTSATTMADAMMSSFQGSLMSVMGSVQSLAITALTPFMNNVLKPLLGDSESGIIGFINKLRLWASENEALTSKIIGFIAILTVAGPVLFIIGQAISFIGFVLAFLTSPIGLIIVLIALLTAAWFNNWGGMRDFINNQVMPIFMSFFGWLGSVWTNTLQPALSAMWVWFTQTAMPAIISFVQNQVIPAFMRFVQFLQSIWTKTKPFLMALWDFFVQTALPAILFYITGILIPGLLLLIDALKHIWLWVQPVLAQLWDWFMVYGLPLILTYINGILIPGIKTFIDVLKDIWLLVQPVLQQLYDWFMTTGLPNIQTFIETVVQPVFQAFIDVLAGIWNAISPGIEALKSGLETAFNWIKTTVIDPIMARIDDFKNAFNTARDLASGGLNLVSGAADFVGGLFGGSRDSGGDGVAGQSYLIGTGAQPELFKPDSNGTFTPADQLGQTYNLSIGNIHANDYAGGAAAGRGFGDGFLEKVRANG